MGAAEDRAAGEAFPAYRRLAGAGHLYRIDGPCRFVELQRIGRRWVMHVVDGGAFPEQVRIQEMLRLEDGRYEAISREEWERALAEGA